MSASVSYTYIRVVLQGCCCRSKKRNLENLAAGDVELTPAELAEIDDILAKYTVKGGRYNDAVDPKMLHLWG